MYIVDRFSAAFGFFQFGNKWFADEISQPIICRTTKLLPTEQAIKDGSGDIPAAKAAKRIAAELAGTIVAAMNDVTNKAIVP
jgi:hypothetical protein